jgi:hypothetical protein
MLLANWLPVPNPYDFLKVLEKEVIAAPNWKITGIRRGELPIGAIVGSAVIEKVTPYDSGYGWHLRDAQRLTRLRKPTAHPQPVWFKPF